MEELYLFGVARFPLSIGGIDLEKKIVYLDSKDKEKVDCLGDYSLLQIGEEQMFAPTFRERVFSSKDYEIRPKSEMPEPPIEDEPF